MTLTYGEGERCERFLKHDDMGFSSRAICFECRYFQQPLDDNGDTPWVLDFDDRGTCAIGSTNP
jgi:hypothetical protein